jgi:hypothetical protein
MLKNRLLIWDPELIVRLMFFGGCYHSSPERMANDIVEDLREKLELNGAQQQKLHAIKDEILVKIVEMKKSEGLHHEEIYAELQKDVLNQGHLKRIVDLYRVEIDDLANLMIELLAKFHGTLSPEQKKKLVEYLKRHKRHPSRRVIQEDARPGAGATPSLSWS